jgi:amino acid permease
MDGRRLTGGSSETAFGSNGGDVEKNSESRSGSISNEICPVLEAHRVDYHDRHELKRGLKARHVSMIAMGGAVGKLT